MSSIAWNKGETGRSFRVWKDLSFAKVIAQVQFVGEDIQILLWGGEKPHIGCTVLSVPRPSMEEKERGSCTSSVINVTGHKDEALCRAISEEVCRQTLRTVVCTGGFHLDGITGEQICRVQEAAEELKTQILEKIHNTDRKKEKKGMPCTNH